MNYVIGQQYRIKDVGPASMWHHYREHFIGQLVAYEGSICKARGDTYTIRFVEPSGFIRSVLHRSADGHIRASIYCELEPIVDPAVLAAWDEYDQEA